MAGHVHLACGRIVGGARAIAEAHRYGVADGPHDKLWTPEHHGEAVRIYAKTLPASYQRDIASLFARSADALAGTGHSVRSDLVQDWQIVTEYVRNASVAIMQWLGTLDPDPSIANRGSSPEIDNHTPVVIRWDLLAALSTSEGARCLERAAVAVQQTVSEPSRHGLNDEQRRLLTALVSGMTVVNLAAMFAHSERSMYRELRKLFDVLGVPNRVQAVHKAAAEGLID